MLDNFYYNKMLTPDYIKNDQIDQPYIVTSQPKETAISVDELKEHLRLPQTCDGFNSELSTIVCAVQSFAQSYTGRVFITTSFKTYRDYFPPCIELRQSPFQSLISFKYLKDDTFVDVDSELYYIFQSTLYNKIELKCSKTWPEDIDCRKQAIEIEFTAGYGSLSKDVPCDLRIAMLNHAAKVYTDRGDCDPCGCTTASIMAALPSNSKLLYNKYRAKSISPYSGC